VDPPARLYHHIDYFGTEVIEFGVADSHDHLLIQAESRVRVEDHTPAPELGWEAIETPEYKECGGEFLESLAAAPDPAAIADLLQATRGATPLATLKQVCELIPDRFEYRPGATYVGSTVDELLEGGAGVCQDFVHLALTLLRSHGIAARYVSGYLFAPNGGGSTPGGVSAEVHTHAWVGALVPTEDGKGHWVGADPTNRGLVDSTHVKIGHGREYADVAPIRGVYRGAPVDELDARVRMTLLDT
jgi:transglutaminase-like putative cysteine protease